MIKEILPIFEKISSCKLVYLFGSRGDGNNGPLSDFDFAVYLSDRDKKKINAIKFRLLENISSKLKTDKVDIVILNLAASPELKYNIIKNGKLIYCVEPYKILVEPKIMNEYFDFHAGLKRYGLTKVK